MPRMLAALACGALLLHAGTTAQTQGRPLSVTSASPNGEVGHIADANEMRVVFSEPMIEIGGPVTGRPSWLTIEPAVSANFYWSGTRTLIATIDPDSPLPYATRFTVRIDGTARSASGRTLGAPHTFSFVTPTVRLLSANWYRKSGRFDSPAVIALLFNQPVRAADVASHARVQYTPHEWRQPEIEGEARDRLERDDPAGYARFKAKVDAVRRVANSTDTVPVQPAAEWDVKRFPPAPDVAVIETTTAPAPEAWLTVTLDAQLPGAQGLEKHAEQQTVLRMEPAFFVSTRLCNPWCNPAEPHLVSFSRGIEIDALDRTLTVRDISDGTPGRVPARNGPRYLPTYRLAEGHRSFSTQQIGYEPQPPNTKWLLRLDGRLQAVDGQTLDYPWMGIVDNGHEWPMAGWPGQVWESRGGPQVPFLARNIVDAHQYLQPLPATELMPILQALNRPNPPMPTRFSSPRRLAGAVDALEGHGIDLRQALSTQGTGVVWAAIRSSSTRPRSRPDMRNLGHNTVLQVTNLGLTVKDSPQSTLVFVTRLDNAEAVPSARIAIIGTDNQQIWSGTTNADGIALAPALPLRTTTTPWLSYVVTAEKDGDVAWVASDWTGSVHPSNFGLPYQLNESRDILRGSIFTDRGVYKQGEEIQIKGVIRGDTPTGIRVLPEGTRATVTVRDARGTEVDRRTITLNRWSSLDGTWRVPDSAALGTYSIAVSVPDLFAAPFTNTPPPSVAGSFLVAAFRRPDFRVDTTVEMQSPVLGAPLRGAIDARYLFGAPLGARPARWFVMREPVLSIPSAIRERYPEQQFAFGYLPRPDALPQDVRDGTTVRSWRRPVEGTESLDAEGRLRVEVPTQPDADFAATYRFEGDVEGVSGQRIANRAAMVIHPASFYVGLGRPPFFADVQKGLTTSVVAVDLNGAPRAGVPATVTLLREQWGTVRDRDYPGSSTWTRREVSVSDWKVTTSSDRVPLTIPLREGGCYILRATAQDEQGRSVRTDVTFYAFGRGVSTWRSEGNRIDLTPERITWSPGQTARILVQSPWERATALVTVEREGIRRHWRANISSMQDTIDVPITDDDIPNVFVSVLLLKGRTSDQVTNDDDPGKPSFRVGYAELTVDDASKRLRVGVSADRQEYRPRQDVTVSVSVADAGGRPRASEVTLWAIDHGLLSLTNYTSPDVARAIYARKALQVQTQDNRARLIGRRNTIDRTTVEFAQRALGSGGGGGGRGGAGLAAATIPPPTFRAALNESIVEEAQAEEIRADFRPLVFWLGSLTADANGRATTTVTLPDSLTTYRIMAVAGDLSSHFGSADAEIRATKPLTMLPAFPRFLARSDRASFGAVVTNGTGAGGEATVTIQSSDASLIDFGSETRRTVYIAPGESVPVRFDAATRSPGRAIVRMSVTLGAEKDTFEMPLPVIAPARMETVAAYGDTTSSATERLTMPAGLLSGAGGLTVSLASTALVGLGESARYVDEYPYPCAEPIASRALVLLLSANLDGVFGPPGSKPDEQRAAGIKALRELSAFQCPDGGFRMWSGGPCPLKSNPYLTAYILHVFHVAASLNVTNDRNVLDRAINFLSRELEQPPPEVQFLPAWAATQAYAVKVLAEHKRIQPKQIDRLYQHAGRMPVFALSYLADALATTNERDRPRYADVVRRISNALRVDADRAHVEELDDAALAWLWNSNVRATAVVLSGMARRGDDNALFAPMVRWLLAARTNGRWRTTHENAIALESLVRYYQAFETETPQMTATVALGGSTIATAPFAGRSTTAQQVHLPMTELVRETTAGASRELVFSRQGTGRLFYTARLQYQTPLSGDAVDRGIRVERRYEPADVSGSVSRTEFANGDLVRVRLSVAVPHEGRFLVFTDPIPAGFEAVDALLATTASDLARQATDQSSAQDRFAWWRRGGFEHVEKHDDRVVAYATRLAAGRHELTYLIRATTAGTFNVPGTSGEAIYAPEITGRGAATTINVR